MLDEDDRKTLLDVARASIRCGIENGSPLPVEESYFDEPLREDGACFVTLKIRGELRGCIGTLQPWRPLIQDCADNAFAAAFRDPRFPAVSAREYELLDVHLSVLGPASPMTFDSEEDLLAQLRPGIDGLIIEDHDYRATFLPSVWKELPDPAEFLSHLKLKAGLPNHHWSDTLKVSRYRVTEIHDG